MALEIDVAGLMAQVLSVSAVVAAGAYVARRLVAHLFDQRTELYKADLARELEAHKAQLQHESTEAIERLRNQGAVEVERLRADLRPIAYAAEVRQAELLKRRADVTAGVYRRLAIAHSLAAELVNLYELPGAPPKSEIAAKALAAGKDFAEHYDQHKVFLPAHVCELLDSISRLLSVALFKFTRHGPDWPKGIGPEHDLKHDTQLEAWRSVENEVPAARRELERVMRSLLGDADSANEAA